ncbi:putative membrane protein [Arthrobacter sp. ok909]|uniref:YhgE/Pip family protein n=1 Tax=Arthrobacter sp. ok909 TaxID=1761746 RepID=UPI00089018D6|nr:YhgE/Pip domain-containing protein [Arthrobacter sp. ok909]SDP74892.1 putative membrane protein [Arthrobacter sp. ok909]
MTVLRLARSELKRMTGGLLPKLTILALALVPLLYGAVYLYANWDPYGKLNQIDAALVVEDSGAASADGTRLEAGRKVAESLVDGHVFNWKTVASTAEADQGVSNGTYAFALKIPKDFSANLASPGSFDAGHQAMLNVTTNDANNYLLSTIVDKLTTAVHTTVAKEVGEETANQLLTGFGTIHTQMLKASDGAGQLADGVARLHDGTVTLHQGTGELKSGATELYNGEVKLRDGATSLSAGAAQLSGGLTQLKDKTAALPANAQQLADGAAQVAAGNAALNTAMQGIPGQLAAANQAAQQAAAQGQRSRVVASTGHLVAAGVLTQEQADAVVADVDATPAPAAPSPAAAASTAKLQAAATQVQRLADGSAAVSAGASQLAGAAPALSDAVAKASAGADQLASGSATLAAGQQNAVDGAGKLVQGAQKLDDGAAQLESGAATASDGAGTLAGELAQGAGKVPNPDDSQKDSLSKVMADPVAVSNVSQAKAGSYGAGLAPFFLTLALWIGVFMLVQAMRPVTQRALASNAPAWKIAAGGWLPFLAVSAVQASLLTLVVDVGLGLDPAHPVLMWFLMLAAAMAFSAIIQGVVALLGSPGKLVVLILLVLQLVSSGGTFPWQTTPEPLHVVHQILPMGYVVSGMRHLIYGADLAIILPTMLGLVGYTLLGLAMSTAAVRKNKYWTLKTLKPEIAV